MECFFCKKSYGVILIHAIYFQNMLQHFLPRLLFHFFVWLSAYWHILSSIILSSVNNQNVPTNTLQKLLYKLKAKLWKEIGDANTANLLFIAVVILHLFCTAMLTNGKEKHPVARSETCLTSNIFRAKYFMQNETSKEQNTFHINIFFIFC